MLPRVRSSTPGDPKPVGPGSSGRCTEPSAQTFNRRAHDGNSAVEVSKHQLRVDAHDVVAKPLELPIPPRISGTPERMTSAIDLHDEPNGRREQIHDVPIRQHDLPAEVNA